MKNLWRTLRGVLHNAAVQAAAKVLAGLLAALGGLTAAQPQLGVDVRNAVLLQEPEQVVAKP